MNKKKKRILEQYEIDLKIIRKIIHKAVWMHLLLLIIQIFLYGLGIFLVETYTAYGNIIQNTIRIIFSLFIFSFLICTFTWITSGYYKPLCLISQYEYDIKRNARTITSIMEKIKFPTKPPQGLKQWIKVSRITIWTFIPILNIYPESLVIKHGIDYAELMISKDPTNEDNKTQE